jgi:hypothetical protein
MKQNNKTYVAEEHTKTGYIIQSCAVCDTNHDYQFRGRTIVCICGAVLRESADKKHKLIRIG